MTSIRIGSVILIITCIALTFRAGDAAQKEKDKLDGTWYVARQEQFGGAVPAIVASRLSVVIDGDKMEWYTGTPAPNMAATITVDPEKKTIDAKVTRGSLNGKTMLGIYKFDDGRLHVCWAEIDAKRPATFASTKPGGGVFEYTIYSRTKEKIEIKPPVKEPVGAGKKSIRTLQAQLTDGWKDDGTIFDERRFIKDRMIVFASIYKGPAPAKAEDLAEMAKKNENLLPGRTWVKTTGIGKLPDGVFIVGVGQAMGFQHNAIGAVRTIDGVTVLFLGTPADDAAARKAVLDLIRSASFGSDAPPVGKRPKLADLKLTVPKGWEAKYSDAATWKISHGGFAPSISALWMVPRNYPKDVDDLVKKMQDTDYFGNGLYLSGVTEKGKLPDGLFVVGRFKQGKAAKEDKTIGFAIIREFGGEKLIFESFSSFYDDAKLLKAALDICKSAKF